jgi:hypothetical protein
MKFEYYKSIDDNSYLHEYKFHYVLSENEIRIKIKVI